MNRKMTLVSVGGFGRGFDARVYRSEAKALNTLIRYYNASPSDGLRAAILEAAREMDFGGWADKEEQKTRTATEAA